MRHMKFDFEALDRQIEHDWPVRVSVPLNGGKVEVQEFSIRFRLVSDEELEALGQGVEGAKASLRAVIVGFGKDETADLTEALLEKMLDRAYVRSALNTAYGEFALGIAAKNSRGLRG